MPVKPTPFNWKSGAYPLVTFFVGDVAYTYFDNGILSKWNQDRNAGAAQSSINIPKVDRIIFHDGTTGSEAGAFLTGFNVLASTSAAKYKQSSLVIDAQIRCMLQSVEEGSHHGSGEAVSIQAKFDAERLSNLWMSHLKVIQPNAPTTVDLLKRDSGAAGQKNLRQALADLASGRTSPVLLRVASDPDGIYTEWSHVLRYLLNDNPRKGSFSGPTIPDIFSKTLDAKFGGLTVSFRENDDSAGQYMIEFEASFAKASAPHVLCLSILAPTDSNEANAQFRLADKADWYFRQRSSVRSCAVASSRELNDVAEWTIELQCLSGQSVADNLSRWNSCAVAGIPEYSGASGASLIPNLVRGSGGVFSAVYQVADRSPRTDYVDAVFSASDTTVADKTVVRPFSVQYIGRRSAAQIDGPNLEVTLEFPLCATTTRQSLRAKALLCSDKLSHRDTLSGFIFTSKSALYCQDNTQSARMRSIELVFGTIQQPYLREVYFRLSGTGGISIDSTFALTGLLPGGQDDLPEDSLAAPNADAAEMPICRTGSAAPAITSEQKLDAEIEQVFYRPKPLLINRKNLSNTPLLLRAIEQAGPGINRTVQLSVNVNTLASPPINGGLQKTIILDEDPFLVAQISFPQLLSQAASNQIAVWNAVGDGGGKWQIPLTKSGFSLALPSQIMGEEMIKELPEEFPKFPIEFRLGPPAVMAMESGPQLTAYAEVPWNLRRILGYASQTSPGVRINRLDYELLYGLSCDASLPWVRLAEVFAVFGAIPGRLPQKLATDDPAFGSAGDALAKYSQWRKNWADLYKRYQARLAVLEPQDGHVAGSTTLKHGMSCVIRYKVDDDAQKSCSQTLGKALLQFAPDDSTSGHPYRLPPADLEDPINSDSGRTHLRGGVTWGFESRNIFCATLRNEFSTADSAAVSDLDFTALGAYGHQQASFDEGRTAIFGDATLGRTYYYKLERIGRIAVFWNKAKHVIVYERSVVPSRQFYLEQNPQGDPTGSYGIPMLRKVEEYVEILEEERHFPDDHVLTNPPSSGNVTPAQRLGCVAGCVFQKGARIKVDSAWGSDVISWVLLNGKKTADPVGWKVPLWKRGALPPDIYPLPKISLSLFSDFGGSSKESPCDVANPENVYFYTDTRADSGSDTDKWTAIIGVDVVDMPTDNPPPAAANSVLPTRGDVPVPAGFSPCTFKLLPPLRAANIVANRVKTNMAVALDSVTMMRGCLPKDLDPGSAKVKNVISTYADSWERELNALTPATWTKKALDSAAARISSDVNGALTTAQTAITGQWKQVSNDAIANFNASALIRLSNQLQTATSDGSKVAGGIAQVKSDVAAAIAALPQGVDPSVRLQQLVDEQFGAIQKAVLDASATPGVLTSFLVQYYTAAKGVVDQTNHGIQQINDALQHLPSEARDAVTQLTKQVLDLRAGLMATWAGATSVRPIPELVDLAEGLAAGPLKSFCGQYSKLVDDLTKAVNSSAGDYNGKLKDLKDKIPQLKPIDATTELTNLATILKAGFVSGASGPLTYLDFFRNDVTFVDPTGAVKTWAGDTRQALNNAVAGGSAAVKKAFDNAFDGFNTKFTDLQSALTTEVGTLDKAATTVGQSVTNVLQGVTADASTSLTKLQTSLATALQNLPDVAGTPQQIADMQQAVLQFRDAQLAEAHQYVDKYLGTFRSYQADITSGTTQLLSLVRGFGDAPVADTLSFLPGKVGYYFKDLPAQVNLSPVTSILRQAGNVINASSGVLNDALNVMHLQVPAASLADRLVPPNLANLKLSDIFPKFAGLDLSHLFQDIKLNENGDKIRISHGTDPQTTSAWVQADIGSHLQDVPIFETSGIALRLKTADFVGQVRVDVSPQGTRQAATGNVVGDWTLMVLGQPAVTLASTQLLFDNSGKLQFKVDPKNVQLPGVLDFVTQYLGPFLGGGNGLSVRVEGTQVVALLNLPIPDISGVTSGISNLSLSCRFAVGLVNGQFQLDVGFGLSDPQKPFNIAFFILGGAGYLTATTSFAPTSGAPPSCRVNFGIMASASLAIAFGPISGGVYAFLGIRAGFSTGGPGLSITAVLLLRGQVNLAGIVSASVCMELAAAYDGHQVTGNGSFSISVTICWCFTLNISVGISYPIGSFGGQSQSQVQNRKSNPILLASLKPGGFNPDALAPPVASDELARLVGDYVAMTKGL